MLLRLIRHWLSVLLVHGWLHCLLLIVLLEMLLLVLLATLEDLLRNLSVLKELPLEKKLRAVERVAEEPISVLAIENVPELIRELSVAH